MEKPLKSSDTALNFQHIFECLSWKKNETATISTLNFRGEKYLHRALLLMNGNFLRNKFTVYKFLANGTVRGIFFSKYSKRSFEFAVEHWWDSQGWFCCMLTLPECTMNLSLTYSFLSLWLPVTLIFILIWLLSTQCCSEPGCVLKAGTQLLEKSLYIVLDSLTLLRWRLRVCALCWSSNGSQYQNLIKV